MEDKIISFSQFCEVMKKELPGYLPEVYSSARYKVVVEEIEDTYNQVSTWLYINDEKDPLSDTPRISMEAAYENMKQIKDIEKVIKMLAEKYGKQYEEAVRKETERYETGVDFDIHKLCVLYPTTPAKAEYDISHGLFVQKDGEDYTELHVLVSDNEECRKTIQLKKEQIETSGIGIDDLYKIAMKNTPQLLPLSVRKLDTNSTYDKTTVYSMVVPFMTKWNMYESEALESLAELTNSNLYVVSVSDDTKLAVCADSVQVLEEIHSVMGEMKTNGFGFSEESISLYEKDEKRLITDRDEIETIVSQRERQTKSIFNLRK